MKNLLSTAQSAAALFAQVTGAQLTTNFDLHGERHSLTDEPWPTVAWADGSVTDFLPGEGRDGYEVHHFDAETCGVGCATAPADATVAQVLGAAFAAGRRA